jgi:hypothetical protein
LGLARLMDKHIVMSGETGTYRQVYDLSTSLCHLHHQS